MYQIISDGSCDLEPDILEKYEIQVVPFYVSVDDEHYRKEREEVDIRDFYRFMVENPKIFPKTSLPSVQDYLDAFLPYVQKGIPVICLCITSRFSGSFNSADNARRIIQEEYPEAKIRVIDTMVNTVLQGLLVVEAGRMRQAGYTFDQVVERIDQIKGTGRIFFTIGSMDYLVHGGRVGKLAGMAISTLGIRPLIVLREGEIHAAGIARGREKSKKKVLDSVLNYILKRGKQPDSYAVALGFGYDREEAKALKKNYESRLSALFSSVKDGISLWQIGATIGVHTGPHPIGFGIIERAF